MKDTMTNQTGSIIKRLPPEVIARIAAGEMITRPASAVKELVENALDAGAGQIGIEVTESLDRCFRITDDGRGMNKEELSLSLERYATSKLSTEEDLLSVATLGFRGEALASIAEIARVSLLTKSASDSHAWEISADAGNVSPVKAAARGQGTTVIVEDLFYNTPVRKRFLKKSSSEMRLVKTSVSAYALSTPQVGWNLEQDGKKLLELSPAHDLKSRLTQIHGTRLANGLIEINWRDEQFAISGVIGVPELAKGGTGHQTFFVNGRWIFAPWISQALRRGFGDLIPNHQNPWAALFLEAPGQQVDVNLHPTKREVHFLDERRMFSLIQQAVHQAVAKLLPRFFLGNESQATPGESADDIASKSSPPIQGVFSGPSTNSHTAPGSSPGSSSGLFPANRAPGQQSSGGFDGIEEAVRLYSGGALTTDNGDETLSASALPAASAADLVALWQLHQRYVLAQTRKGLLVIDQHAAHERILYEKICHRMTSGDSGAQQLLFPVVVELDLEQMELFQKNLHELAKMGFDVEEFSEHSVLVRGVPPLWRSRSEAELLRDLLDEVSTMGLREGETVEGLARSFACRAAIKSGEPLGVEEMNKLVDELFATERPHGDPHGRPTFVFISLQDLDQRFGRV